MSIGIPNTYGRNELLQAAFHGDLDTFKHLFEKDKNHALTAIDDNKDSAAHLAAMKGNTAILKFLVANGAQLSNVDRFGATPLHLAAATAMATIVRYLLEQKVNINPTDHDNNTPAHLAARNGHGHTLSILIKGGADLLKKNKDHQTVYDIAHNDCIEILKIYKDHLLNQHSKIATKKTTTKN